MRVVSNRFMPVPGSKRARRTRPESTIRRMPSIVRLVSAMLVASTILRSPVRAGCNARSCCSIGSSPYNGNTRTPVGSALSSSCRCVRRISPWPGRNTSTSPVLRRCALTIVVAAMRGRSRSVSGGALRRSTARTRYFVVTSKLRPAAVTIGASPSSFDYRSAIERRGHDQDAQIVAHVLLRIQTQCQAEIGMQAAFVKLIEDQQADEFERGIVLQPARQDAFGDDFDPRGVADARFQTRAVTDRWPTLSPSDSAMRVATARAASRRGSSMTMRCLPSHGASSNANGTRVDLPAPGGACSTTLRCATSAARSSGSAVSMGRGAMEALTPMHYRGDSPLCGNCRRIIPSLRSQANLLPRRSRSKRVFILPRSPSPIAPASWRSHSSVNHCTSTRRFFSLSGPAGSSQPRPTASSREASMFLLRSIKASRTAIAR